MKSEVALALKRYEGDGTNMAFAESSPLFESVAALSGGSESLRTSGAYAHAARYFLGTGTTRPFAGSHFETIGHAWRDPATIDVITPFDLLALGCLSTPIAKYTAPALLAAEFQVAATSWLREIAPDTTLASENGEAAIYPKSPASSLYELVRSVPGMGPTRASKLLARKRPNLIPIRDSFLEAALSAEKSREWWAPMRDFVLRPNANGDSPWEIAVAVHRDLGLTPLVTPLRVVDAILWMSQATKTTPDAIDSDDASL